MFFPAYSYSHLSYYSTNHIYRLQSKKSQPLVYDEDRDDSRKTRRKSRRKRQGAAAENLPAQLKEVAGRADGSSKSSSSSKKKNSKFDWQRAVNLNSRMKDARGAKASFLAIEADSLKLLATSTTPKKQRQQPQQQRPRKLESRRKFRGVGTVASTCIGVANKVAGKVARLPPRTPTSRARSRRDAIFRCESSSSDDASSSYDMSGKPKTAKKKQKKKKQQQQQSSKKQTPGNRTTEQRKRASSAKALRDNV